MIFICWHHFEQQQIIKHSSKISQWIRENQTSLLINEVYHDRRTTELKTVIKNIGSLLSVPLIFYDKVIGILYAAKFEEYGFEMDDQNMLQAFADQATVALENARLLAPVHPGPRTPGLDAR